MLSKPNRYYIIIGIIVLLFILVFNSMRIENNIVNTTRSVQLCEWKNDDAILYNLKSSPHVNFEGNHWFHVAENFMVQHSILRASDNNAIHSKLPGSANSDPLHTSSEIYFNLERSKL